VTGAVRVDPTDEFTVAIGYGTADADSLAEGRFDYWALGGEHQRTQIDGGASAAAIYCGTPQGRCLQEPGPHGYTLVDIDSERTPRIHAVQCDLFRYCVVELDATDISASGNIRSLLGSRVARLLHDNGSRNLIIGWDIAVSADTLHCVGNPQELLTWLRREYGHGTPAAWTAHLKIRPPKHYPKNWCDEDTILGDFLRAAQRHGKAGGRELNLAPITEEHPGLSRSVAAMLAVGMLMFTPTIEVDDRGEPVPGGATPEDQYKGLYLEARGYLLTGEVGQAVDTESRTSLEQHGAGVALFFGLPVLMVVFAWWMHRRTGLSRPLTIGMLAVAVAVFLLQTSGQFYIPALIALAVGSFQARKAEMPARMAERMALQEEREARRKERDARKSGDTAEDSATGAADVIDVDSREKDD
jgi:hypothetical protein